MNNKKWLYLTGIIVIVIPVLFLYVSFNSTFLSKWKAKQVALKYLETAYEDGQYTYESTGYSFKDKSYYVRYFAEGPITSYSATVEVGTGLWPTEILYTYINDSSPDEVLDNQISDSAATELKNLLKAYPILEVYYDTASPSTLGYTTDTFSIYEKKPFIPSILITIEKGNQTEAEILKIVKGIQGTMNKAEVFYANFQVQQEYVDSNSLQYIFEVTKADIQSLK